MNPEGALLAVDQGTSSSRAIAFTPSGEILEVAQHALGQIYPRPGWVEQDPEIIIATALKSMHEVVTRLRQRSIEVIAIGLTNQRETTVAWNRRTGLAIYNAISWQDRRTEDLCHQLAAQGEEERLATRTGLRLDPYFSAGKMSWILDNVPEARAMANRGELALGTIDSFLISRLARTAPHVTDASNASRTALYDIRIGRWDAELCSLFSVPVDCLAEVRDCAGEFAMTDPAVLGARIPITGVAGDQQAALMGQAALHEGDVKGTYGTGAFLMLNTGEHFVRSTRRLLTTIAYRIGGRTTYALEGSILSAGATIQWLRDGLGLFDRFEDVEPLANSTPDSAGVYLVPAFAGLGAPYWELGARGAIVGLTRSSNRAHLARAGLDSAVFQTRDLLDAMRVDGVTPAALKVDGGMTRNALLLQRLADILEIPIQRPRNVEATAWGAACLAGLGAGVYRSLHETEALWRPETTFMPQLDSETRQRELDGWRAALRAVLSRGQ